MHIDLSTCSALRLSEADFKHIQSDTAFAQFLNAQSPDVRVALQHRFYAPDGKLIVPADLDEYYQALGIAKYGDWQNGRPLAQNIRFWGDVNDYASENAYSPQPQKTEDELVDRFGTPLPESPHEFNATPWLAEWQKTHRNGKPLIEGDMGFQVLDIKSGRDAQYLLIRLDPKDSPKTYATLRLPTRSQNYHLATLEIDGEAYPLSFQEKTILAEAHRLHILKGIFGLLTQNIPGANQDLIIEYRDQLELQLYRDNDTWKAKDSYQRWQKDQNNEHENTEIECPPALAKRLARYDAGDLPVLSSVDVQAYGKTYTLQFCAEDEKLRGTQLLQDCIHTFQLLPPLLFANLDQHTLQIQIAEDDIMGWHLGQPERATAFAIENDGFRFNKKYLTQPDLGQDLYNIAIHEWGHHFVSIGGGTFLPKLLEAYQQKNLRDPNLKKLQAVSIYNLSDVDHLVVECAVAYINGEKDQRSSSWYILGERSRQELREKMPEMYLMLKLHLEPASPYFKNWNLLAEASLEVYRKILASPDAQMALAPETSAQKLAEIYVRYGGD